MHLKRRRTFAWMPSSLEQTEARAIAIACDRSTVPSFLTIHDPENGTRKGDRCMASICHLELAPKHWGARNDGVPCPNGMEAAILPT